MLFVNTIIFSLAAAAVAATAVRQETTNGKASLSVDLGYSVYSGVENTTFGIKSWKGYVTLSI